MSNLYLILFFAFFAIAFSVETMTMENVERLCDALAEKKSVFFPFRCVTDEEKSLFGAKGAKFAERHTVTGIDPVILIPGIGGSALESKLEGSNPPNSYCYSQLDDWRRLWLNLGMMLPVEVNCWYYDIALHYNAGNHTWSNNEGVFIRPMDFGGVEGIDYMDRIWGFPISLTTYFAELIEDLKSVGYTPGKNIRGAPFDWRLADNPDGYFGKLKALIENTYSINDGRHVHLVAHSYGNIHTAMFLNTMSQAWKDKFIGSFISVAAPWSGSPSSLRALVSGDNFGVEIASWFPILDGHRLRPIIREAGGPILLVPETAYWPDQVLVQTPTKSYKAADLVELFTDMNSPVTVKIFNYTDGIMENIQAPNVDLHCLYGINFPTETAYNYKKGFDVDPEITYSEEGDGTVPIRSLRECKMFANHQSQAVEIKEFDLADHFSVLNDPELLEYILKIITTHQ